MFKWIFKNKNKKTKMVVDIQAIQEHLSKFKVFQWIKSENAGTMCNFKELIQEDDIVYVVFDNNTRVNYEYIDEFVKCLEYDIDLEPLDVKPSTQVSAKLGKINEVNVSPLKALLDKQKINPTEIEITLSLNIPSKKLFDVIKDSFDNAELEVLDYVVDGVNIESVKDAIKKTLAEYYGS